MNYSSKPVLIIAISLFAIWIGIPRAVHADAASPSPTLAVGDWWKYNFQTNVQGLTLTGPVTEALASQQTLNIQGTDYNSYRITLTGGGGVTGSIVGYSITGSWTISGDDYMRASDLADVKAHVSVQISIQIAAPIPNNSFTITQVTDSTNNPPSQTLQFPLATGDHWSVSLTSTTSTTTYSTIDPTPKTNVTTTTASQTSDVISYSVVSVPAGSFDAYLVRTNKSSGYTQNYYSPEVENMIKIQDYNSTGGLTDSFTLSSYNAWAYKSTIETTMNGKDYTTIIGTDVSTYNVHQDGLSIIFQVTGTDGVTGKASVWIPVQANNTDIKVLIDTTPATFTTSQNQTEYQILFTYPLSTHTIIVTYAVKLQSSFLQQYMLPISLAAVGILAIVLVAIFLIVRKKPARQSQPSFWQPPATPPAPTEGPPPAQSPQTNR